jgi:hypothetical protein
MSALEENGWQLGKIVVRTFYTFCVPRQWNQDYQAKRMVVRSSVHEPLANFVVFLYSPFED